MHHRSLLLASALLGLASLAMPACGQSGSGEAGSPGARRALPVVGGEPAAADDYPSTVALTDPGGSPFCTGTLVAPTVVVTAAHCLESWWGDPISPTEVRVVYGYTSPETAPASARLTVSEVMPHPSYAPYASTDSDGLGHTNDIGVVVLNAPVANGVIAPILPATEVDAELLPGTDVHVVGFGVYNMSTYATGRLYKAITPHIRHIPWEMLAGSPGNPDSCNGDSGGPAYVVVEGNLYLAGITSRAWAKSTHQCGDGGIYTLAPQYVAWIESIGGELDGGVLEGGWDGGVVDAAVDAPWLDADPACMSPTGVCNPVTNEGCATGEACQVKAGGAVFCHPAPNTAQPGALCDATDRFCVAGFHCATSIRCERLCCSDADCPAGGPCVALHPSVGTLGTCGLEPKDSGVGGAAGAAGSAGAGGSSGEGGGAGSSGAGGAGGVLDAGADARPSEPGEPAETDDDGGCGCRTAGGTSSGALDGLVAGLLALVAGVRRRRRTA